MKKICQEHAPAGDVMRQAVLTRTGVERPHEDAVQHALDQLRLDWRVTFNCRDVMGLPRGVDKASGPAAPVAELGLTTADVVAVGDDENDCQLLRGCGRGVAVANALPATKAAAHTVAAGGPGRVVRE